MNERSCLFLQVEFREPVGKNQDKYQQKPVYIYFVLLQRNLLDCHNEVEYGILRVSVVLGVSVTTLSGKTYRSIINP